MATVVQRNDEVDLISLRRMASDKEAADKEAFRLGQYPPLLFARIGDEHYPK